MDDGLPTNICHRCLYNTEFYSEYREKVLQCETKLHDFVTSLGLNSEKVEPELYSNGYVSDPNEYTEEDTVVVVDPTKIYDSSDEENDAGDTVSAHPANDPMLHNESEVDSALSPLTIVMAETAMPKSATQKRRNSEGPEGFRNVHFCQYCEAAFVDRAQCVAHETTSHDPYTPHVCNFCAFRCASRNVIIAHIKECHEPEKPFVCIQCNKKFGRRSDLKKHSVCHTGIRPFGCPVCSKSFSRNTNLTKHMKIHEGMRPYICPQCPRSFSTTHDLQRHELIHDETKKLFQCTKCPAKFSRRDKFQHHERNHLRKELMAQGGDTENMVIDLDPFLEQIDEYSNRQLAQQQMSLATVIKTEPKTVSTDGLETHGHLQKALLALAHVKSENGLSKHYTGDSISFSKKNPPKPSEAPKNLACDQCPKKFNKRSSLQNHRIVHMGRNANALPTHTCNVCPKVFKTKRELDRHGLVHTGIKSFECLTCFRRFARKDKLVRHEKIHQERLPPARPPGDFGNQMAPNEHYQHPAQMAMPMPMQNSQLHMMMMAPRANFYMNNDSIFSEQNEGRHESV